MTILGQKGCLGGKSREGTEATTKTGGKEHFSGFGDISMLEPSQSHAHKYCCGDIGEQGSQGETQGKGRNSQPNKVAAKASQATTNEDKKGYGHKKNVKTQSRF